MKLSVLGPRGTFSHEAALQFNKSAELVFVNSILDVFESLEEGKASYGVVPVENSIEGGVNATLDALMEFNHQIKQEIILPVRHYLCGTGSIEDVKSVSSHPQALGQCRKFIHSMNFQTVQSSS